MSNGLNLFFVLNIFAYASIVHGQDFGDNSVGEIPIPSQSSPPQLSPSNGEVFNFNANTNLVGLLSEIRKNVTEKRFDKAQSMASAP